MTAIPLDHDTIVCHPDDAAIFAQFAGMMKIVKVSEMERGKAHTVRSEPMFQIRDFPPTFEPMPMIVHHGPRFVPDPRKQAEAWATLTMGFGSLRKHWSRRCATMRWALRQLLDPNYRHPKRIRK
jgi:hypothetical protein